MILFYAKSFNGDFCQLDEEESKHCVKVLRMKEGDPIHVTDGEGTLCVGHIVDADSRGCTVAIEERKEHYGKRKFHLHVAIAPTKNNARTEWFIEKAVEIGIDTITPIICQHSERCTIKQDRLEKIVRSAMMQSVKTYRTNINPPTQILDLIHNPLLPPPSSRFICHCQGKRKGLGDLYTPSHPALILIGPEGDFSRQEIDEALAYDFKPVTLGSCRLRTETAALYATTVLNFLNEL